MNSLPLSLRIAALSFSLSAIATAAPAPAVKEFKLALNQSTYETRQARDPFADHGPASVTATGTPTVVAASVPLVFHLDGILYQVKNPSASVNGHLLTLNQIVKLNGGAGEVPVKAVEITRDRVVLEANGQQVELRLDAREAKLPGAPR